MCKLVALLIAISCFGAANANGQEAFVGVDVGQVDVSKILESGGFTKFSDLVKASGYIEANELGARRIYVLAPTDEAWDRLSPASYEALFAAENKVALDEIVGCHIVTDPNWGAAIARIKEEKGGQYEAESLGGCNLKAQWSGTSLVVLTENGNGGAVRTGGNYPGLEAINGVFLPLKTKLAPIVTASRLFAGPSNFPPTDFAAYGIVAFKATATETDRNRHQIFCNAYVGSLPHSQSLERSGVPISEQMGTVWPISSDSLAAEINKSARSAVCAMAIDGYGLVTAEISIKEAEGAGAELAGRGPFLIAWAPPSHKGRADAIVLVYDLSDLTTEQQAKEAMEIWSLAIEGDEKLWTGGWNLNFVRLKIQYVVDEVGQKLLSFTGVSND